MIDWKAVSGVLGALIVALGIALLLPAIVGLAYGEGEWWGFAVTAVASLTGGAVLWRAYRPKDELRAREGFAIVALAWLVLSLVGAVPYLLTGVLESYTNAVFETMSGFTTTGATILGGRDTPAIESVPNAFLFWRSLTHWLGGMGIIVLTLAVLPLLGIGGMQLFKAEVPGPQADKLTPRVTSTAKRLWAIYVGLTAAEVILLLPAMSFFDAVNHAFATLATGGFSTENGSVGQYGSAYIDGVVTVFMFLAGMNFALHYGLLHGRWEGILKSDEFRLYAGIVISATVLMTLALWQPTASVVMPSESSIDGTVVAASPVEQDGVLSNEEITGERERAGGTDIGGGPERGEDVPDTVRQIVRYESLGDALRYAGFQATAIVTTTGFGTADYELWPPLAGTIIFLLFFTGGMAGSTGGGVKIVRHLILGKASVREMRQLLHPEAILPIRMDHEVIKATVVRNVFAFMILYLGLIAVGTFVMAFLGLDLQSAFSAAFSCVGNVGPAFGTFGPTENYTHVPALGKWVLSLLMMAGRLEIFTVLLLFTPSFWKR